ncbi:MAG: hypothetical protein LAT64_10370 [Phycisphaerales bacterium]|nr:hypothetical protein [Planctomycetota bacterium]MCH8509156.1 hypothetical protein [Phycisphaerales bacterium]
MPHRPAPPTSHRRPLLVIAPAGLALLLSLHAGAAQPEDRSTRMDEAERVLPRVSRTERVVVPTRSRVAQPVRPGLTGGADWAEAAGLRAAGLPEGTFLIERPGHLIDAPGGRQVFVPTAEDRVAGEGPMLILPSASLERLMLALTGRGEQPAVRVSGEVFVYHGRSHLLMSSALIGHAEPEPDEAPAPAEPREGADDTPESLLDDPDVRRLLEELEAARPGRQDDRRSDPVLDARESTPSVAPAPDGTPVLRRRGRLVRTGEGAWAFVFDNDLDDPISGEAMIVMPCRLLERMERRALVEADAFQLQVSGRVHTFKGEAYLLPTMMLEVPVSGIVPMQ